MAKGRLNPVVAILQGLLVVGVLCIPFCYLAIAIIGLTPPRDRFMAALGFGAFVFMAGAIWGLFLWGEEERRG